MTADCAVALAERRKGMFVLLGRSAITPWPDGIAFTADENTLRANLARQSMETGQKRSPKEIGALARSALASQEIARTIAALEAAGAEAHYFACDLTDRAGLQDMLKITRKRFWPVQRPCPWRRRAGRQAD